MIKRQPGFLSPGSEVQDDDEPTTAEVAVDPSRGRPMETVRTNQCTAHRKNGERCRKSSIKGATVCRSHGGAAPQVQRAARTRLLMASDDLMKALLKIATSGEDEGVRLRAVLGALDRAGFSTKAELEVTHELKPFEQIMANLPVFTGFKRGGRDAVDTEESARLERESASETQRGDVVDVEFTEDPPERTSGRPMHMEGISDAEMTANRSDPHWRGPTRRPSARDLPTEMEPGPMPLMSFEEAYGGPAPCRRGTRMSR